MPKTVSIDAARPDDAAPSPRSRKSIKATRPGEILDAAFEEFVEKGYSQTRLEDVARRVGLTKGALYLYFPSKLALFKAVVRSCTQPIFVDVEQLIANFQGPMRDLVRALIDTAYRNLAENRREREIVRLLMSEGSKHPELNEFYFTEAVGGALAVLDRVIERGTRNGEFRRSAVTDMPLVLLSPVVHAANWELLFAASHPLDIESFKRAHIELVLAVLLAPAEAASPADPSGAGPSPA
jgi:AcrR family transcriptional regulator